MQNKQTHDYLGDKLISDRLEFVIVVSKIFFHKIIQIQLLMRLNNPLKRRCVLSKGVFLLRCLLSLLCILYYLAKLNEIYTIKQAKQLLVSPLPLGYIYSFSPSRFVNLFIMYNFLGGFPNWIRS